MAQKIQKTNVCRLLDAAGIAYELIEYEVDESDLSATHVAQQLGEDVDAVFKTIVLEGDKVKHFVCVVPGACEVDLYVSAGQRGMQLRLAPQDLIEYVPLEVSDLI